MSREIKFRVYSNSYKKYLDTSGEGIYCEVHHLALKPDGKLYYADIGIEYPGTLSECPTLEWKEDYDDCVVEQYTGLTDKNGKEIYEGDIVQFNHDYYKVFWDSTQASFRLGNSKTLWWINTQKQVDMVVVSNVHENSELLGGEE